MVGADKPIKPLGVETESDGLDPLLLEIHNAMLQSSQESPDLTGAEAYLSAADWRALEDCRRQLADKLHWKTTQSQAVPAAGTQGTRSEETPAMSMASEETPARLPGQRLGIDVYHSTCEPSIPTVTLGTDLAGRRQTADAGAKAAVAAYHQAADKKSIGGFRFLRLLGQGGQGKVFLCRCPGRGWFLAIRGTEIVLTQGLSDAGQLPGGHAANRPRGDASRVPVPQSCRGCAAFLETRRDPDHVDGAGGGV